LLTHTSRYINEVANLVPNERAAFVGRSAFGTKGGIHVSAVMKAKETYEHINPEDVGQRDRVLGQRTIRRQQHPFQSRQPGRRIQQEPRSRAPAARRTQETRTRRLFV
jgi:isopropylmalate/homocitrate/citramalate synthase